MKRKNIFLAILPFLFPTLLFSQQSKIDSLSIEPLDKIPGKRSIYVMTFSLREPLLANAQFQIEFRPDFDLSGVLLAGSNTINGGIQSRVENQVLFLSRTGQGAVLPAGTIYEISFANIRNPAQGRYDLSASLFNGPSDDDKKSTIQATVSIGQSN